MASLTLLLILHMDDKVHDTTVRNNVCSCQGDIFRASDVISTTTAKLKVSQCQVALHHCDYLCKHRLRWFARWYMQLASKHAGCKAVDNLLAEGVNVIAAIALHDAVSPVPMLSIVKRIAAGMCIQYMLLNNSIIGSLLFGYIVIAC